MLAVGVAGDLQVNWHLWLPQNLYPLIFFSSPEGKSRRSLNILPPTEAGSNSVTRWSKLVALGGKEETVCKKGQEKKKKWGPKSLEGFGNATKAWRAFWRDQRNLQSLASASNFLAAYPSETPTILRFAHKGTRLKRLVPDKQLKHKSRSFWTSKWPD